MSSEISDGLDGSFDFFKNTQIKQKESKWNHVQAHLIILLACIRSNETAPSSRLHVFRRMEQ